jgi:hypothetical protein
MEMGVVPPPSQLPGPRYDQTPVQVPQDAKTVPVPPAVQAALLRAPYPDPQSVTKMAGAKLHGTHAQNEHDFQIL